jgi:hypothetical protein
LALAASTEQADVYRLRAERSEHKVEELESLMRARQVFAIMYNLRVTNILNNIPPAVRGGYAAE